MHIVILQIKALLDEIVEKLPDEFNMMEIMGKVEERTPYIVVAFQECERMNTLTSEIRRSLKELDLGLKVGSWEKGGRDPSLGTSVALPLDSFLRLATL